MFNPVLSCCSFYLQSGVHTSKSSRLTTAGPLPPSQAPPPSWLLPAVLAPTPFSPGAPDSRLRCVFDYPDWFRREEDDPHPSSLILKCSQLRPNPGGFPHLCSSTFYPATGHSLPSPQSLPRPRCSDYEPKPMSWADRASPPCSATYLLCGLRHGTPSLSLSFPIHKMGLPPTLTVRGME